MFLFLFFKCDRVKFCTLFLEGPWNMHANTQQPTNIVAEWRCQNGVSLSKGVLLTEQSETDTEDTFNCQPNRVRVRVCVCVCVCVCVSLSLQARYLVFKMSFCCLVPLPAPNPLLSVCLSVKSNQIVFVTYTWLADVNASVAKCLCF